MKKYTPKALFIFIIYLLNFSHSFAQIDVNQQNENFERDIDLIVEELKFMYDTDQALREYTLFKTYNKAITDSIENLSHTKVQKYIISNNFKSDSLGNRINKEYILPIDILNTERMIELTKIYGFSSTSRIKKNFKKELENKHLNRCEYGHILWHLNGRKKYARYA